ncbi:MAG: porin family protein [Dysgonomonas sp.]|nr:porin family protein [Dysgonomonas sp.]
MDAFRKVFAMMVALFLCNSMIAQEETKSISFQIRGGMNISNLSASDDHYWVTADPKVGYNVGAAVDFPIGKGMYIHSGLSLTSKGAKVDDIRFDLDGGGYTSTDMKMNAVYLQVPLYFAYKLDFSRWNSSWDNKLGLSAGPFIGYGVFGKTKVESGFSSSGNIDGSFDTFGDWDLWNRTEVGLGFEASFELKKIVFYLGTEVSLTNVWKKKHLNNDAHVANTNVYLGVGYSF